MAADRWLSGFVALLRIACVAILVGAERRDRGAGFQRGIVGRLDRVARAPSRCMSEIRRFLYQADAFLAFAEPAFRRFCLSHEAVVMFVDLARARGRVFAQRRAELVTHLGNRRPAGRSQPSILRSLRFW